MMKIAVSLALVLAATTGADAEPLTAAVAARIQVPAGLAVDRVYVPTSLQALDVAEGDITVESPRVPQPGRASVRVSILSEKHPARTVWVQVELVRAPDGVDKPAVAADAPVVSRGAKVTAVVRAGALVVRAPALVEAAARVGETATIRITATHVVARGTLVAADTVEVAP
jgi:hypothetical protein